MTCTNNNNNPKMEDRNWKNVRISVDIMEKVTSYLEFLKVFVRNSHLWESNNVLKRALYRYEKYWLPLVAEWKIGDLEPPRDVKWVWHLHMLSPKNYIEYCQGRFGKIVPHKIKTSHTEEKAAKERTSGIWKDKYLQEPFELESDVLMSSHNLQPSNKLKYLVTTSSHQATFLYQVLLPHYTDKTFTQTAFDRYRQFLYVQKKVPNFCGEPPYDIHLFWRVHMLHPAEYYADMDRSFKRVLDPMETLADVTGYMTSIGDAEQVWSKYFNESLFVGGSFFRGSIARGIHSVPKEFNIQEIVDSCEIVIDDVVITDIWTKDKDVIVDAKRIGGNSFNYEDIFTEKGKVGCAITSSSQKGLGKIHFDAKEHRGIQFQISCKKGKFCMQVEKHIATVFYNPGSSFTDNSFFTRTVPVELPKVSITDPHVRFTCHVKAEDRKPHVLTMERIPFTSGQIPADLLKYVMNEPFWSHSSSLGLDEDVLVAKHVLTSKLGPLTFHCEVIKHELTDSSAVLLYLNGEKLVCVAHTISPEQLPNLDQVSRNFPLHMDPQMDLAMLIRNSSGDWCIVKGSWMSETMPGYGKVQVTVYNLQKDAVYKQVIRDDELQSIKLEHVTIDMPTGRFTLGTGCDEMAENITLGYCVGIMFLTCQKRAVMVPALNGSVKSLNRLKSFDLDNNTAMESIYNSNKQQQQQPTSRFSAKVKLQNKKRNRRRKMSASFTFLLACGLQVESYFYQSQPSSRNSTITLNDVPVVTNQDGDVKFVANVTSSNGQITSNGGQTSSSASHHFYSRNSYNLTGKNHTAVPTNLQFMYTVDKTQRNGGAVGTNDVLAEYDDPSIQDIRL